MDAAANLGRNPVSKHQIQPEYGDEQAGLEKLGLVDQNWLERNFSGFLLRTLVVGRRQHSESIEVALDME